LVVAIKVKPFIKNLKLHDKRQNINNVFLTLAVQQTTMENKKTLSADQLNNLKEQIRQRFDELYHRIGKNRQNLLNKVLFVHHQINKELTKEDIDDNQEKDILRRVRETERSADSQLPHIHKVVQPTLASAAPSSSTAPVAAPKAPKPEKPAKPEKEAKPKEQKAKAKPKPEPKAKTKSESKGMAKAKASKKKKK
jgi:hypothetical protein